MFNNAMQELVLTRCANDQRLCVKPEALTLGIVLEEWMLLSTTNQR